MGWTSLSFCLLQLCNRVSVLVLKMLPFKLLDLALDPDGRYVLIHVQMKGLTWVIADLYLPLPASLKLLNQIMAKVAEFNTDNIIILRDFNLVPDLGINRLAADGSSHLSLATWVDTYGRTEVEAPQSFTFTCHSASHKTFFHIDLDYVGGSALPRIRAIRILPKGVFGPCPAVYEPGFVCYPL